MKASFRRLGQLGGVWILLAMPLAAATARIYITNHAGTTISIIDPKGNKVVGEIKDIEVPEAVDFSPDGSRLYITQGPDNVVTVIDRKTGKRDQEDTAERPCQRSGGHAEREMGRGLHRPGSRRP